MMPAVKLDTVSFVHVPRSAGTSIGLWLKENVKSDSYQEWYTHPMLCDMGYSLVNFTVVRNPWDRMVSFYEFSKNVKNLGHPHISNEMAQKYLYFINGYDTWPDFNTWVENLPSFKLPEMFKFTALTEQTAWAKDVNFVLKYENLSKDFVKIQDLCRCYQPLPYTNYTAHNEYKYLYTEKTKDLIYRWFKNDIDTWEYEF